MARKAGKRRARERGGAKTVDLAEISFRCDPARFPFRTTAELEPLQEIIGQDRALHALQVGLELDAPGFNLYVSGLVGNGRTTAVQSHLRHVRPYCPLARDRAYVYSFSDPRRPRLLTFARGRAHAFARAMDDLIVTVLRSAPPLLGSADAHRRVEALKTKLAADHREKRLELEKSLGQQGFQLVDVPKGDDAVEVELRAQLDGFPEPLSQSDVHEAAAEGTLNASQAAALEAAFSEHGIALRELLRAWHSQELSFVRSLEEERGKLCAPLIDDILRPLRTRYGGAPDIDPYFDEVREDLLENIAQFVEVANAGQGAPESLTPELAAQFFRYRVNVVLDNRTREGCPVVVEAQPTFTRLFGGVERPPEREIDPASDFLYLRAGSLLEADGGFLILDAGDVLREPSVWARLKATLRHRVLEIPEADAEHRRLTTIKPAEIPIDLKVVLLGSFHLYQERVAQDAEFEHIFKVRVDFAEDLDVTDELIEVQIPRLIRKICDRERLLALDRGAVAAVVERAVRWSGRRDRVSAVFTQLADLVREASYWGRSRGAELVEAADIAAAVRARDERNGLQEERSRRMFQEGTLLIQLAGHAVGQLSGLVVRTLGSDAFGMPARITARAGMGNQGIINIEREVGLSGESHDKGVQILTGYLRGQYAHDIPLTLAASICFEQSYGGVDGDSASTTEMYALLSAIAGLPLRQDLAVTGSMNQLGEVQAVGGINEKIEGFFRVVRDAAFPAEPGVIIPRACVPQLHLEQEVVDAVAEGRFRIFPISSVDEGIALLAGIPAGSRDKKGRFPAGTVHGTVEERLRQMARGLAQFNVPRE